MRSRLETHSVLLRAVAAMRRPSPILIDDRTKAEKMEATRMTAISAVAIGAPYAHRSASNTAGGATPGR